MLNDIRTLHYLPCRHHDCHSSTTHLERPATLTKRKSDQTASIYIGSELMEIIHCLGYLPYTPAHSPQQNPSPSLMEPKSSPPWRCSALQSDADFEKLELQRLSQQLAACGEAGRRPKKWKSLAQEKVRAFQTRLFSR